MSKLIRNINNTQPFNKVELSILKWMYKVLGQSNVVSWIRTEKLMSNNFKDIFGLSKEEVMYFMSLYEKNFREDGDFKSLDYVIVPIMREYDVDISQNVDATRTVEVKVWAGDDNDAKNAAHWDFYNNHSFTKAGGELTYFIDDSTETGDVYDVYDTIAHQINPTPLNETRVIIKKILNEYRRKI